MALLSKSGRNFTICPCCDKPMTMSEGCFYCSDEYCGSVYGCWKCRRHACGHCKQGSNFRPCGWCKQCHKEREDKEWEETLARMKRNTERALGLYREDGPKEGEKEVKNLEGKKCLLEKKDGPEGKENPDKTKSARRPLRRKPRIPETFQRGLR